MTSLYTPNQGLLSTSSNFVLPALLYNDNTAQLPLRQLSTVYPKLHYSDDVLTKHVEFIANKRKVSNTTCKDVTQPLPCCGEHLYSIGRACIYVAKVINLCVCCFIMCSVM